MSDSPRRPLPLLALVLAVLLLPLAGKGGMLASAILLCALLGAPLFALIGFVAVLCFVLWAGASDLNALGGLVERVTSLVDSQPLIAIALFMASGTIMGRGQISTRLVQFAQALVGWLPGGLAISGVLACMMFASISGSSPATVVAIGGMLGPSLLAKGYEERFSHGLLTSAGSLGILIPPSIPMIIYPIVNQKTVIQIEKLFLAGVGPGMLIGGALALYCMVRGVRDDTPRAAFSLAELWRAGTEGFWALMFPVIILGGIYSGVFTAVESAGISVVYAVVVEVWIHRAIPLNKLASTFQETAVFLGSLLVIMVAALSFNEFLETEGIPALAVEWIKTFELQPWQFLLLLNAMLLAVGMLMDILSAMLVFVPLLAPVSMSMGVDPIHFGIIFIVNLEIGYLTPPVGLNLFVAGTLFERPLGHIIRSVAPFIAIMMVCLGFITYYPALSVGLADALFDDGRPTLGTPTPLPGTPEPAKPEAKDEGKVMTMEEMMRAAQGDEDSEPGEPGGKVMTMEEMMRAAEEQQKQEQAPAEAPAPGKVMTMEEMMREAERRRQAE